jgi:hypothetical protein
VVGDDVVGRRLSEPGVADHVAVPGVRCGPVAKGSRVGPRRLNVAAPTLRRQSGVGNRGRTRAVAAGS